MEEFYNQKNGFMITLEDHLRLKYGARWSYPHDKTFSFGQPIDNNGFFFYKDKCSNPPRNEEDVLNDIDKFASEKGYETKLIKKENPKIEYLKIKLGGEEYLIIAGIDKGYAGEIRIECTKSPRPFLEKIIREALRKK